jgi:RHS repeat-associated protein
VITNDTGSAIQSESDYMPYGGEIVIVADTTGNQYKFTGKERDTETDLDYFGARYYAHSFMRFMTPDWAATPVPIPYAKAGLPQSLNLYSYVENNPITGIDPDGHDDSCGIQCQLNNLQNEINQLKKEIDKAIRDGQSNIANAANVAAQFSSQLFPATANDYKQSFSGVAQGTGQFAKEAGKGMATAAVCAPCAFASGYQAGKNASDTGNWIRDVGFSGVYNTFANQGIKDATSLTTQGTWLGASVVAPFAKGTGVTMKTYEPVAKGGPGGAKLQLDFFGNYVRIDIHRLHFNGQPVTSVPHLDFKLFGLEVKHFPFTPWTK